MGLFCEMLHVLDTDQAQVEDALGAVLRARGFSLTATAPVDETSLEGQVDDSSAPAYIVGPKLGRWTPIIDLHAEPWPTEICAELSRACSSSALCLMDYDDDVMFYNLYHDGECQDGYSSDPQYFEEERVPQSEIQAQRHTPEVFATLLPRGRTVQGLLAILDAGWWEAHDAGRLDDQGVMSDDDCDDCPYEMEGERMTAFGGYLGLAGQSDYPFTDWREDETIDWQGYHLLQFG